MKKWLVGAVIMTLFLIYLFQGQMVFAVERNIFQKPKASTKTKVVKTVVATTTPEEDEARIKELLDILGRNATVTYPFIAEKAEIQQAENQVRELPSKAASLFMKFLPYILGLIILLVVLIMTLLIRWLKQEGKTMAALHKDYNEQQHLKATQTEEYIGFLANKEVKQKPATSKTKKTTTAMPIIKQVEKKIEKKLPEPVKELPKGIINLKEFGKQKTKIPKRLS